MGEIENVFCLVHIDEPVSADVFEVLYANRIKHFAGSFPNFYKVN